MKTNEERQEMIEALERLKDSGFLKEQQGKYFPAIDAQILVIEKELGFDEVYEMQLEEFVENSATDAVQWLAGEISDIELMEQYQ